MPNRKPPKSNGTPASALQGQMRQLKKKLKRLEFENAHLLRMVHDYMRKEALLPEARAEMEAWAKREVVPLLKNPKALEAALKGPTLLDIIRELKGSKKKSQRRKGA